MLLKRQTDILTDMMDYTSGITNQVTDYSVGSVIRSFYEAFSLETETLYLATYSNIEEGIEAGLLSAFNFSPKPASKATGDITIEFYSPLAMAITIDKGTRFSTGEKNSDIYYETKKAYMVPAGSQSAVITVEASVPGTIGNVLSGEIGYPESTVYNVARVYNRYPFLSGSEEETYAQARDRFNLMIQSVGRGTKSAILYGALSVEEVQLAKLEEFVGYVNLYVGDSNGVLSQEVKDKVINTVDEYRSAGIKVNVLPIDRTPIDIDMQITLSSGFEYDANYKLAFERYLSDYINNLPLMGNFIVNDFVRYALNFDSNNIYDLSLNNPTQNYNTGAEEVLRAGNIAVSYTGGILI